MGWNFRPGIRTEIAFTLTILMAGAVALVGFLIFRIEERNLLEQRIVQGKQALAALQEYFQEGKNPDAPQEQIPQTELQLLINLFSHGHPFSQLTIVDREFRIIADSLPERIGKTLRDEDLERTVASGKPVVHGESDSHPFSLNKGATLLISYPLITHGPNAGGFRAEVPIDDLRAILFRSQAAIFLYFVLTAFMLIVVGTFILSRVVKSPLKRLVQATHKISEGDLGFTWERPGADEVGKVFDSLNQMAARLREDRAQREEYIQSLERMNRQLRSAQEEIILSEKLASIGRLASSIAHEVGNPTGAILGYLDLLIKNGLSGEEEKEILRRAEEETERIQRIVRELLDFSRPCMTAGEEVDVHTVITRSLFLLSHQRKVWETIQVEKDFQESLPKWKGDPHQLQQVMVNLLLNAADALASKNVLLAGEKRLRIVTKTLKLEEVPEFLGRQKKEGDSPGADYFLPRGRTDQSSKFPQCFIQIRIEDTGPGIPAEDVGKIFDPFYSTKPQGEGTGLGLAICVRILEACRGRISVRSEEGKGTIFTILLPVFEGIAPDRGNRSAEEI